jgi:transcription elongation factor Elf1
MASGVDYPSCPNCGSAHTFLLSSQAWFRGMTRAALSCHACGRQYSQVYRRDDEPEVEPEKRSVSDADVWAYSFATISLCPACRERGRMVKGKVRKTKRDKRYMVCPECDHYWSQNGTPLIKNQ